jgi:glycosyltransferase involved in cell wall biosynthesis
MRVVQKYAGAMSTPSRVKCAFITTDARVFSPQYSGETPVFGTAPFALLTGFAKMPEVELHVISCARKPMESVSKLAENIWFHSLPVAKRGWLLTGYQGCIRAVRRKLKEIQPDIVHGQGTEKECALSAVFSGFPNVVTIHGNMLAIGKLLGAKPGSFYWFATMLENLALARTDGVFCNSAYTEDLVRPRTRRTWRVPNPLAEIYFSELPPQSKTDCPVLVNVGHVGVRKRQVEILGMAAALHAEGFKFEIQFFGFCGDSDSYGREFLQRMEEAEKSGYARYLGPKPVPELVAALDASQGMIHFPSEEAFGLAPAEGLARNLKLFGSKTGGIIDIATGAEGAKLIDADDWSGLQAAVGSWLKSGAPRPTTASAEMRSRYHPVHIARRHVEIYREVLGKKG